MKKRRARNCLHCLVLFTPDPRQKDRQRYCSKKACQCASHAESQRQWRAKRENQDYFRGADQVRRVQAWRRAHPGYSKKKPKALQDSMISQPIDNKKDKPDLTPTALQEPFLMQQTVLVGLISILTGCALQDEMVRFVQQSHHRGQEILTPKVGMNTKGNDDGKACSVPGAGAQDACAVQLG